MRIQYFEGEDGRQAHLNGKIAKALMDNASTLLAKDPVIEKVDVLVVKKTGSTSAQH